VPGEYSKIIVVIVIGAVLFLFMGCFVAFFLILYRKKYRSHRIEKESMQLQYQHILLQTQLEIQEQTLKNISQEIHDNVGQVLSLAKLNLNMMDITRPEQLQKKIDSTLGQVTKAINDLRDLSKSFNTDNITALGLINAIAYELDMIGKTDSHKTEFKINGNSRRLESQKELILFRIVQEALHNIIKHAGAKIIKVEANYAEQQLELKIGDNGKGFDLSPLNQEGNNGFGLGIRNMHNRAKLIGADFTINSTLNVGTVVKIVLPFTA
jgi:two-component system, NarL family, sensor kinase